MSRRNPSVLGEWGPDGKRVIAAEPYWRQPLRWDREAREAGERRRVFCASLADVFEDRPELVAPRVRLFHLITETPHLDWLLLTKRPENVRRFHGGDDVSRPWPENMPPNVWLGTSVENQPAADARVPLLLQTPAAVRWLSCEPLLGEVNLRQVRYDNLIDIDALAGTCGVYHPGANPAPGKVDWIVVGGESGPGARPMALEWARSLVAQCKDANCPVFVKQLGANPRLPDGDLSAPGAEARRSLGLTTLVLRDRKGGDMSEFPEDLRVREYPTVKGD